MPRPLVLATVRVISICLCGNGLIPLLGYILRLSRLYQPDPEQVAMAPMTAFGFLIAGFCLFSLASLNGNGGHCT